MKGNILKCKKTSNCCDNVRFLSPRTIIVLALRALFPDFTPKIC